MTLFHGSVTVTVSIPTTREEKTSSLAIFQMKNAGPSLLCELSSLQARGEMCDTMLVGDNGSMMVHWPVLEVSGVWWSQSRPGSHNTVIFPGVTLAELTSFVERIYSLSEPEIPHTKKLVVNIEKLPLSRVDWTAMENSTLVKDEGPESPENFEDIDNDHEVKSEYSDQEDDEQNDIKSSVIASSFVQLLENGDIDRAVDEQYQQKRNSYPDYININKEILRESVSNIKLTFLTEKKTDKRVKYLFSCRLCDYKTKTKHKKSILWHMTTHFKAMFNCRKCEKEIRDVKNHIKKVHSGRVEGWLSCEVCSKEVKTASQLARHMSSHDIVYCDQCDFSCEGRRRLGRHREKKHPSPAQCHICSKVFTSRDYLKTHLALHGDEVLKCDQCDKTYKSLTFLRSHINLTHRAKEINCEFCGQTFANNTIYRRHRVVHTKEKSFSCLICDYKGSTKQNLKKHMEIHEEAKLSCSFCGRTFRQKGALKAHVMTHTGERPYACSDCSYRCIQPGELRKHFLKKHSKVIERPGLYLDSNKKV